LIPGSRPAGVLLSNPSKTIVSRSYTGTVDFVVTRSGALRMGESHAFLAGGQPVLSAGRATFHSGRLIRLDNWSGHYKTFNVRASIPESAFSRAGFSAKGLYRETYKRKRN
jgi:hypothetical protein